jgi:hypothetical protein
MQNAVILFGHPCSRYINVLSRFVHLSKLPSILPLTNPFIIILYSSSLPSHDFPKPAASPFIFLSISVAVLPECNSWPHPIFRFPFLPPSDNAGSVTGHSGLGVLCNWWLWEGNRKYCSLSGIQRVIALQDLKQPAGLAVRFLWTTHLIQSASVAPKIDLLVTSAIGIDLKELKTIQKVLLCV